MIELARTLWDELGFDPARFFTESFIAPTIERPDDDGRRYTIRFRRSEREVSINGATTLLEAARQAGLIVPTGCERGLCRACVTPKLRGVTQRNDDTGITLVTICNSLPCSDVELDL